MPQEVIKKNHMDVAWHEYTDENGGNVPVVDSSIAEKASIIGRVGIMFLSCGTGAWRVRSSMNTLADGEVLRFLILSGQYRGPIDFNSEILEQSKNAMTRLRNAKSNLKHLIETGSGSMTDAEKEIFFIDSTLLIRK